LILNPRGRETGIDCNNQFGARSLFGPPAIAKEETLHQSVRTSCVDQQDHANSASLKRAAGRRVSKHSLMSASSRPEVRVFQGGHNAQKIFPPHNFPESTTTKCGHIMFPKHKSPNLIHIHLNLIHIHLNG
jgi:hypothetical protein